MSKTAVIVIDAQREYGPTGGLAIAGINATNERVLRLTSGARTAGVRVIHVRHVSRDPHDSTFNASSTGVEFLEGLEPLEGEAVITKQYPGAFTETSLDRLLQREGVSRIAICGYTSFLCCDSTSRQAFELGYEVLYVEDAIGEFSLGELSEAELHRVVSAVQGAMFSEVVTTDEAVDRLSS